MDFADLMRAAARHDDDDDAPRPLPESQIAELRVVAERYLRPCPFKVGDLVTPAANSPANDAGEPHLVVEILDPPIRHWGFVKSTSDFGDFCWGCRVDMAVLVLDGHNEAIVRYWCESWQFVPYPAEAAE